MGMSHITMNGRTQDSLCWAGIVHHEGRVSTDVRFVHQVCLPAQGFSDRFVCQICLPGLSARFVHQACPPGLSTRLVCQPKVCLRAKLTQLATFSLPAFAPAKPGPQHHSTCRLSQQETWAWQRRVQGRSLVLRPGGEDPVSGRGPAAVPTNVRWLFALVISTVLFLIAFRRVTRCSALFTL